MGKKILVVDDDPVIISLLDQGLSQEGFEVLKAVSGEEGIQKAQEDKPALVILDILLPQIDGTEVAGLLQEDVRTHHIPVIYLTGLEAKEDIVLNENLQSDIIFSKPVDVTKLIAKVKEVTKNTE